MLSVARIFYCVLSLPLAFRDIASALDCSQRELRWMLLSFNNRGHMMKKADNTLLEHFTASFHPDIVYDYPDFMQPRWMAQFAWNCRDNPKLLKVILDELRAVNAAEYPDEVLTRIWDACNTGWSIQHGLRDLLFASQAAFETVYLVLLQRGEV